MFEPRLVNYAPFADLATGIFKRGRCDHAPASQKCPSRVAVMGGHRFLLLGTPCARVPAGITSAPLLALASALLACFCPSASRTAPPPPPKKMVSEEPRAMRVAPMMRERGQPPPHTPPPELGRGNTEDAAQRTPVSSPRGVPFALVLLLLMTCVRPNPPMPPGVAGLCSASGWRSTPTQGPLPPRVLSHPQRDFTEQPAWKTHVDKNRLYCKD